MEFDPPIATRSTDELIEIANYTEKWNADAVIQAKEELIFRGVTVEEQNTKVSEWNEVAEQEYRIEMQSRAIESYGLIELIWMTIRWPFSILSDWNLRREGYLRLHKERLLSILAGILLSIAAGLWVNYTYERNQQPWLNEVNRQDIYDWEREYYTDEELAKLRRESIEQVIKKVKDNQIEGTTTYVIIDSDTILNSDVERLRILDPLAIRDVVFERDFEPKLHEWITVKMVKTADDSR